MKGSENNELTIIGYNDKKIKEIIIPEKYKGLPVTKIESSVFSGLISLKSIIITQNITRIGQFVFLGCKSLTEIIVNNKKNMIQEKIVMK